jgi:hypothetical protein
MKVVAEHVGFFAAHSVWCASEGETLVPLLGFERRGGEREMIRFAADLLEKGVEQGRQWLDSNPDGAIHAVLIYDGFVTLESGKTDALVCLAVQYQRTRSRFTMVVPYRSANSTQGFAVFRPKFVDFDGPSPNYGEMGDAFFRGVDKDEMGAAVWNRSIDQSR